MVGPMNQLASARWEQGHALFRHGVVVPALLAAKPILAGAFVVGVFRKAAWIADMAGLVTAEEGRV
jgi:hypothetical protein